MSTVFSSISGFSTHFELEGLIECWVKSLLDDLGLQLLKWERERVKEDETKLVPTSPHACQEACKAEQTDQPFRRCPFSEDPLGAGVNIQSDASTALGESPYLTLNQNNRQGLGGFVVLDLRDPVVNHKIHSIHLPCSGSGPGFSQTWTSYCQQTWFPASGIFDNKCNT